jgi:hypothetical protein
MIKLEQLQRGRVYRLQSRNLECGVWNGKDGFIGIRTKFGLRFLDMEIHWDLSKTFGTAQALEELGTIPESISLKISLRTDCGNCMDRWNTSNVTRNKKEQAENGSMMTAARIAAFLPWTTRPARRGL